MEEMSVLIERAQSGDKEAREVLIEKNLGLVHHIVRRFLGRGHEAEDLFQIGVIGLIKSIDKFDLGLGLQFSTYAVPMITGEIKRFLRDDGPIKVSRTIKENALRIRQVRQRLQAQWGREPTMEELSNETALSPEEIVLATEATAEVESIYAAVYQDDGSALYMVDRVADAGPGRLGCLAGEAVDYEKENLLNHMLLKQLMEKLDERESALIRMRYFENKTQTQVAEILGISQVQVSRLEKKILLHMRQQIA
ncbi:MAG: SigB/SigF/SigG family RNA polymerase sigma factor [Lachnospiraceae bacterium]|nr:SigB/SigF/SigG family RNA polymerase sigma factor [Lachnospiraceae bacterium]